MAQTSRGRRVEGVEPPPPQVLLCLEAALVPRHLTLGPALLLAGSMALFPLLPTRKHTPWARTRIRQDTGPGMKVVDPSVPVITHLSQVLWEPHD